MQLMCSETRLFIGSVFAWETFSGEWLTQRLTLSYSRGAHGISQKLVCTVSEHYRDKSFHSKIMDNWYLADPVFIAQQQRLSSLIAAEPGPSRADSANFASSHSKLSQVASPQARPVNFPWIDNTAMPCSASSLQMSMPFQQSSCKQLASKGI